MRFFWKIILIAVLPLGGYWLYKKSDCTTDVEEQSEPTEPNKTTSQSSPRNGAEKRSGAGSSDQIIEELSNIDGVTSRVAKNLVNRGIKSKETLMQLSEEELRSVKGIGPKRAAKILEL